MERRSTEALAFTWSSFFIVCVCRQISALHKYEDLLSKISAEAALRLMPTVSISVYFSTIDFLYLSLSMLAMTTKPAKMAQPIDMSFRLFIHGILRTICGFTSIQEGIHPIFTARCYASAVLAMGLCLCLCLSVTSRSSTITAKRRITQTIPHDSPGTLVS